MGFDINCGVRLVRTNLMLEDVLPVKEELTQSLYDHIPVGVGSKGVISLTAADLNDALVRLFVLFCFFKCFSSSGGWAYSYYSRYNLFRTVFS